MILEMDIVGSRSLPRVGRPRRWLMILPLVVGLCMLAAQGTADDGKPTGSTTLVALGDADQSSFSLPSLDGPAHELARLRGRVVLVHFFATWCEPCRAEMASLRQLQSRLDGRPFAIVPISVAEADGTVRRFFADDPLPFAARSRPLGRKGVEYSYTALDRRTGSGLEISLHRRGRCRLGEVRRAELTRGPAHGGAWLKDAGNLKFSQSPQIPENSA
jgi:thiol-disulfide isomerase/thioredoxin